MFKDILKLGITITLTKIALELLKAQIEILQLRDCKRSMHLPKSTIFNGRPFEKSHITSLESRPPVITTEQGKFGNC